ncbi:MAG TPA: PIN domain nuclease [Cytophagaceae bacterium]|nr:PIN domain nuclease [Cytophagaceae bacterium]
MQPVIFDSTIWIDYLNGTITKETDLLYNYLENDYKIYVCPVIVQEVLQGIKEDKQHSEVKEIFSYLNLLTIDHMVASIGAAELYRTLRKKGLTIRKSNDCMIAFYALYFDLPLIHNDKDFNIISKHTPLKITV